MQLCRRRFRDDLQGISISQISTPIVPDTRASAKKPDELWRACYGLIVGVIADTKYNGVRDPILNTVYLPAGQSETLVRLQNE
jgi:hypothetical protein